MKFEIVTSDFYNKCYNAVSLYSEHKTKIKKK